MARRVACRYYDPPGVWCQECRAARPNRCLEPIVVPDDHPGFAAGDVADGTLPLVAARTSGYLPLGLHSAGCVTLGAGLTAVLLEHPTLGSGLVCSAFALGALALWATKGER